MSKTENNPHNPVDISQRPEQSDLFRALQEAMRIQNRLIDENSGKSQGAEEITPSGIVPNEEPFSEEQQSDVSS